jgi:heme/copper-type cytochrome/quinol oxidase subunit 3
MKASYGKLMMWYFLVSDAFTFAGFLIAYGTIRFSMPTWPEPDFVFASFPFVKAHWPLVFVTFMTFVLILVPSPWCGQCRKDTVKTNVEWYSGCSDHLGRGYIPWQPGLRMDGA